MFAEKMDALMNIAEVSNSMLGREVHINPSHIGRLRSGARPLPKKHEYLSAMCQYLAEHMTKDYQMNAVQKLTGINSALLASKERMALYLEQWILEKESDTAEATSRFISGFSHPMAGSITGLSEDNIPNPLQKFTSYLYGNAGKRKAVEQFFRAILQEEKPRTLLLFSDENMSWLYEDPAFAAQWAELFMKVIRKGNRVKIIHTVSRDMNEMLEAVTKWLPIYMTGMVEPYYYPRLKDGIFQHTFFIAPDTAAVVSSSAQQDTDGMLNLFLTDRSAVQALTREYEHYFALCRPLMRIYTSENVRDYEKAVRNLESELESEGENSYLCSVMPPLFTMPEKLAREVLQQGGNEALYVKWKNSRDVFQHNIKSQHITLVLSEPESAMLTLDDLFPATGELKSQKRVTYTREQYLEHLKNLKQLEKQCENLELCFVKNLTPSTLLFIKENTGVILVKTNAPETAFYIQEKNMVSAFWDYSILTRTSEKFRIDYTL